MDSPAFGHADLSNCERELIHLAGSVQPHGVLLVLREADLRALGDITADMRTALGESVASLASHNVAIEDATTPSLDALKAYTEAAKRRAEGAENEAIPLLERAIAWKVTNTNIVRTVDATTRATMGFRTVKVGKTTVRATTDGKSSRLTGVSPT